MKLITTEMKFKELCKDICKESLFSIKEIEDITKEYGLDDDVTFIRKGLTPSKPEFEDGERAATSYIATKARDRDREIVLPQGAVVKHYKNHNVVLFVHDYHNLPVGKGELSFDDKGLKGKTTYANHPKADEIYQYRKDGFPLGVSVGFIPLKVVLPDRDGSYTEKDLKRLGLTTKDVEGVLRIFEKWLLLEYSDVPIPNNQEALQIAVSKGLISEKDTDLESSKNKTDKVDDKITDDVVTDKKEPKQDNPMSSVLDKEVLKRLDTMQEGMKEQNIAMAEIKAGRVLSGKNASLVRACVEKINETSEFLNELLQATEKNISDAATERLDTTKIKQDDVVNTATLEDFKDMFKGLIRDNKDFFQPKLPIENMAKIEIAKQQGKVVI
jgi:HK97 family phage prohead protease